MNYNIGSQILTANKSYIAATYFNDGKTKRDQVLIARLSKSGEFLWHTLPFSEPQLLGGNETALVEVEGKIHAFIRADPDSINTILVSSSSDDGLTWSTPTPTKLAGYPPNATILNRDIILTVANRKTHPMTISAYLLDAATLRVKSTHILAENYTSSPSNFGYPITLVCRGKKVTTYYREHIDGGAEVVVTTWE